MVLLGGLALAAPPVAGQGKRGLSPAAVPEAARASAGFDATKSAGLFVGVREFDPKSDIATVEYAVDDAVDLAHLFSLELGLIDPKNITVALAGSPQKSGTKSRLAKLIEAGATRAGATQADVLGELTKARLRAKAAGVLVVSFASHGVSDAQGASYILTHDSKPAEVADTSIGVGDVLVDVSRAKTARRILLLDACRERLHASRGVEKDADRAVRRDKLFEALKGSEGQIVLSASALGGFAYDDRELRNGVFSLAVIDGLRGAAPADADIGFITAQTLADYVRERVADWVEQQGKQGPEAGWMSATFEGGAADLPLATHVAGAAQRLGNRLPTIVSGRVIVDGIEARLAGIKIADPDKNDAVTSVEIDWGDGNSPVETTVGALAGHRHRYAKLGTHGVKVTAIDSRQGRSVREFDAEIREPDGLMAHLTFSKIPKRFKDRRKLKDATGKYRVSYSGDVIWANGWKAQDDALDVSEQTTVSMQHIPFSKQFSIVIAMRPKDNLFNGSDVMIAGQDRWFALFSQGGNKVRWGVRSFHDTDKNFPFVTDPNPAPRSGWVCYAGVATGKELILYRDGVAVGSIAAGSYANPGERDFAIGENGNETEQGLPADIDDVRVYGRALSKNEVLAVCMALRP